MTSPLRSPAIRAVAAWQHLRRFTRSDDGPQARHARRALADALDELERVVDLETGENEGEADSLGELVRTTLRSLKAHGQATLTSGQSRRV